MFGLSGNIRSKNNSKTNMNGSKSKSLLKSNLNGRRKSKSPSRSIAIPIDDEFNTNQLSHAVTAKSAPESKSPVLLMNSSPNQKLTNNNRLSTVDKSGIALTSSTPKRKEKQRRDSVPVVMGTDQRTKTGSVLTGIKEMINRQRRSGSDATALESDARRVAARLKVKNAKLGKSEFYTNTTTCQEARDLTSYVIEDTEDFFDPDTTNSEFRKRTVSNDLMIIRKSSVPKQIEILGNLRHGKNPYREYLRAFKCYDLAPVAGTVTMMDPDLSIQEAFTAIWKQRDRVALVYDAVKHSYTRQLSEFDFLQMCEFAYSKREINLYTRTVTWWMNITNNLQAPNTKQKTMLKLECETSLLESTQLMVANNHSVAPVIDESTHSVLYFLTVARVTHSIQKQSRSIHIPRWMLKSLKETAIGTWSNLQTVTLSTDIPTAMQTMISHNLTTLPVTVGNRLIDTLTVTDLVYCALESILQPVGDSSNHNKASSAPIDQRLSPAPHLEIQKKTVVDAIATRQNQNCAEPARPSHVTCRANDTIVSVIDKLVESQSRTIYVLDEDGCCQGALSHCDLLRHLILTHHENDFKQSHIDLQSTEGSSSSSLTDNSSSKPLTITRERSSSPNHFLHPSLNEQRRCSLNLPMKINLNQFNPAHLSTLISG